MAHWHEQLAAMVEECFEDEKRAAVHRRLAAEHARLAELSAELALREETSPADDAVRRDTRGA
jgi:hypothetical protein